MKRQIALLATGLGLSAASLTLAPAAHATDITNPAQNPAPITVTVDGQQYTDGQDTLPGEDDYACTPIPGVSYDFADNEVIYHTDNGTKTVHWTEWDRITSYQVWLKQQSATKPSGSSSSSGSSSTTKTTTTTPTGSSKSSSGKSSSAKKTKSASAGSTSSASASPSDDATASATDSATDTATASASDSASASPSASSSAKPHHHKKAAAVVAVAPSPSASAETAVATDQQLTAASSSTHGAGSTRLAGVLILGAFAAASIALLIGNGVRTAVGRRGRKGGVA
ncbi:hypothetical protein P5P86_05935 [Nocardioides sp. BP30]|uniref:hypothetical protein n=1 Tax=Nocardioides sp. BP30 TaxID=3036374 RepID=UPI002468D4D0|nr:hypothetical protein [Nocardioides sp. BP30]WGL53365.1 hypothetical protein P5P86_05935 [Nocardioides sp. BP30]